MLAGTSITVTATIGTARTGYLGHAIGIKVGQGSVEDRAQVRGNRTYKVIRFHSQRIYIIQSYEGIMGIMHGRVSQKKRA